MVWLFYVLLCLYGFQVHGTLTEVENPWTSMWYKFPAIDNHEDFWMYMVMRSAAPPPSPPPPPPPPKVNGLDIGWARPSPVVWGVGSLFPLWVVVGFWGLA